MKKQVVKFLLQTEPKHLKIPEIGSNVLARIAGMLWTPYSYKKSFGTQKPFALCLDNEMFLRLQEHRDD